MEELLIVATSPAMMALQRNISKSEHFGGASLPMEPEDVPT
jgi:hypothetical protein